MSLFDVLNLIGGLSLFLFGMHVMGAALEKRAGGQLKALLGKLTGSKLAGFLTGLGVTAVIQSSSATTVMVVGFVNSGLMTLKQAIHVIMGANVGTTVTAWLLSLAGLDGSSLFIQLLKPSSFTPVLALIGIILIMAGKERQKDTGLYLTWLCRSDVRHGGDVRRCVPASLERELPQSPAFVLEPDAGRTRGRSLYGDHPVVVCFRRRFAGLSQHRRNYHGLGHSHHHGPEHRHVRDRNALFHRRKHERKARRRRPPELQHHRHGGHA